LDCALTVGIFPTTTVGEVAVDAKSDAYTVEAASKSGNFFSITKDTTGVVTRTCGTANSGSCLGSGTW